MATFSDTEITERLKALPGWSYEDGNLTRTYEFKDFVEAAIFVHKTIEPAQAMDHHPDLLLHGWNKVKVMLRTHSENGITRNDFELAPKLDALV